MTGEKIGDFYAHILHIRQNGSVNEISVDQNLTSSTKLLTSTRKPTVIHFYDGGWGGCRPCAAQMELWAKSYPQVQFLCVCVESRQVAEYFHRMFHFNRVVNCYIPSRNYFPEGYGQLGCSGFIVSDVEGCFVSRKTAAFLQYGEEAFRALEMMLAKLVSVEDGEEEKHFKNEDGCANANVAPTSVRMNRDAAVADKDGKVQVPASVGVVAMDEEHKECTDVMNLVLSEPSSCNLEKLHGILKSHFEHEEVLMKKYFGSNGSGGGVSSFSAIASHIMDHGRILKLAEAELDRMFGEKRVRNKWHEESVNLGVVHEIADAFHLHAGRFDALYESKIPIEAK